MNKTHLSYRTSNPALNSNTFKNQVKNSSLYLDKTMTIQGTVDKTALALCLVVISGYYSFSQANLTLMMIGMVKIAHHTATVTKEILTAVVASGIPNQLG